jgi:sugar phosphate isomerase/epimerase
VNATKKELLAAYWTLAGDVYPGAPTEVSPHSLQSRAEIAGAVGYTGMGLVHADLMHHARSIGYKAMKSILNDNGIRHIEVEFLSDWFCPAGDPRRKASDEMRSELLEAAAELGARNLKASPALMEETPADVDALAEEFTRLCEQARAFGTDVIIEMMPFTNVRTIDTAMAIIGKANQSNGGLLLDIWHLVRGGMDYSEIAKIPAKFFKGIELDDADKEIVGTLFEDTRFQRRLCGHGSFDIPRFLQESHKAGFNAPYYGVEIINEKFRKQPLDVMAKTSYETTMEQVQRAFN